MMKVLLLSDSLTSGAGKAIRNLQLILASIPGYTAEIYTNKDLPPILRIINKIQAKIESILQGIIIIDSSKRYFSFGMSGVIRIADLLKNDKIDIIIVGWCNRRFLNYKSLARVRTRVIIRLSDDWIITGGCHYISECTFLTAQCCACPIIAQKSLQNRSKNLQNKLDLISSDNIDLIFPSKTNLQKFQNTYPEFSSKAYYIPTPVNTDLFRPVGNKDQKNNGDDDIVLTFMAADPYNDKRKNVSFAIECFKDVQKALYSYKNLRLHIIGGDTSDVTNEFRHPYVSHFGYIESDSQRCALLSKTAIFLTPSIDDNVPNTGLEALACGCPLASNNVGGLSEITHHLSNGYLLDSLDKSKWVSVLVYYIRNIMLLYPLYSAYSRDLAVRIYSNQSVQSAWAELLNK